MLIPRSRQEAADPLGSSAYVMPCSVSLPVFLGARRNEEWPSRSHCQSRPDPSIGSEQVNGRRRESAPSSAYPYALASLGRRRGLCLMSHGQPHAAVAVLLEK